MSQTTTVLRMPGARFEPPSAFYQNSASTVRQPTGTVGQKSAFCIAICDFRPTEQEHMLVRKGDTVSLCKLYTLFYNSRRSTLRPARPPTGGQA